MRSSPALRVLPRPQVMLATVFALAPLALTAVPAAAQRPAISVRVTDGEDPVASARVEAWAARHLVFSTLTDEAGVARLDPMPPGEFTIRVTAHGYREWSVENVKVDSGRAAVLDVTLDAIPVHLESIEVVAERIEIHRENTEFRTIVGEVAIELLPVGHDVSELVALTPGARPGHVWGGSSFQANNYRVDGLSINHPGMGGDLVQPSINWIERVEVTGLGAGAQFGGFQGGLVDVVTRSGTNEFGGSIRANHENEALNGSNLGASQITSEVAARMDVEGQVHGPLIRDRLLYFLAGQHVQRSARVLDHLDRSESRFSPSWSRLGTTAGSASSRGRHGRPTSWNCRAAT